MPNVTLVPSQATVITIPVDDPFFDATEPLSEADTLELADGGGGFTDRTHILSKKVTSNPIETGSSISDHTTRAPARLELKGVITQDAATIWQRLVQLYAATEPVTVYTGWGSFHDMVVTELRASEPVIYGMEFELKLTQVIRVTVAEAAIPMRTGPAQERTPEQRRGLVISQVAEANQVLTQETLRETGGGLADARTIETVVDQLGVGPVTLTGQPAFPPYGLEATAVGSVLTVTWKDAAALNPWGKLARQNNAFVYEWRVQRGFGSDTYTTPWAQVGRGGVIQLKEAVSGKSYTFEMRTVVTVRTVVNRQYGEFEEETFRSQSAYAFVTA